MLSVGKVQKEAHNLHIEAIKKEIDSFQALEEVIRKGSVKFNQ